MGITHKVEQKLPWISPTDRQIYCSTIERLATQLTSRRIVDMGGGRECKFCDAAKAVNASVTAVDISAEELALNTTIDDKIVADVCGDVPLPAACADMVVSYAVIEHLKEPRTYVDTCFRVLKPSGFTVHMIPNRGSIASTINRIVGNNIARGLLKRFMPQSGGRLGFVAYYRHCSPTELKELFEQAGFREVQVVPYFYQSDYYHRIPPAYFVSVAWEWLTWKLGLRGLCSSFVVSAVKPPAVH